MKKRILVALMVAMVSAVGVSGCGPAKRMQSQGTTSYLSALSVGK